MQIAVTSQNRKTITEHAGKCRKFWIYDIEKGALTGKRLVELAIEQSLHASHHQLPEMLAGINVLIGGSMGPGLHNRSPQSPLNPTQKAHHPQRQTPARSIGRSPRTLRSMKPSFRSLLSPFVLICVPACVLLGYALTKLCQFVAWVIGNL